MLIFIKSDLNHVLEKATTTATKTTNTKAAQKSKKFHQIYYYLEPPAKNTKQTAAKAPAKRASSKV